ncbi:hypothetical protein C7M84_011763 [Penaeus vannamei]|uniref:Uncharacterized protein n=1 Tax=Penaeus vannamei TaxID=6689 RepID=A0A423T0H4_PENVA|nr:hypothetical protein C7M84_011763 [Penaeus vannamei]
MSSALQIGPLTPCPCPRSPNVALPSPCASLSKIGNYPVAMSLASPTQMDTSAMFSLLSQNIGLPAMSASRLQNWTTSPRHVISSPRFGTTSPMSLLALHWTTSPVLALSKLDYTSACPRSKHLQLDYTLAAVSSLSHSPIGLTTLAMSLRSSKNWDYPRPCPRLLSKSVYPRHVPRSSKLDYPSPFPLSSRLDYILAMSLPLTNRTTLVPCPRSLPNWTTLPSPQLRSPSMDYNPQPCPPALTNWNTLRCHVLLSSQIGLPPVSSALSSPNWTTPRPCSSALISKLDYPRHVPRMAPLAVHTNWELMTIISPIGLCLAPPNWTTLCQCPSPSYCPNWNYQPSPMGPPLLTKNWTIPLRRVPSLSRTLFTLLSPNWTYTNSLPCLRSHKLDLILLLPLCTCSSLSRRTPNWELPSPWSLRARTLQIWTTLAMFPALSNWN